MGQATAKRTTMTAREGAGELGVSVKTFHDWRKNRPGFPQPITGPKRRGMLWDRLDILRFKALLQLDTDAEGEIVYTLGDLASRHGVTQRRMRAVISRLGLKPRYPEPSPTVYGSAAREAIERAVKHTARLPESDLEFLERLRALIFTEPTGWHDDREESLFEDWATEGLRIRDLFDARWQRQHGGESPLSAHARDRATVAQLAAGMAARDEANRAKAREAAAVKASKPAGKWVTEGGSAD